jgi:hypothetical protein
MNYQAHYDRLIERACSRTLAGYVERHHVVPKCLGGSNAKENIVELTAEEHYVAHQLLVKMHKAHAGLAYSAVRMGNRKSGRRLYGWLRERYAASRRGKKRSPFSAEHIANLTDALRGRKMPPRTAEHQLKIDSARRGKKRSPELNARMSAVLRVAMARPEVRAKLSAAKIGTKGSRLGAKNSVEHRAKISLAMKGKSSPHKGKKATADSIAKNSSAHLGQVAWNKGKKATQEMIAKNSASHMGQVAWNKGRRSENVS